MGVNIREQWDEFLAEANSIDEKFTMNGSNVLIWMFETKAPEKQTKLIGVDYSTIDNRMYNIAKVVSVGDSYDGPIKPGDVVCLHDSYMGTQVNPNWLAWAEQTNEGNAKGHNVEGEMPPKFLHKMTELLRQYVFIYNKLQEGDKDVQLFYVPPAHISTIVKDTEALWG